MDNNNDKAITFEDIEFRPSKAYPSSRHADLFLDNGLCANIFEDHKDGEDNIRYVISLSKDDEYIDFSLPSICERTNNIDAKSKDELIKILNIASQITEDDIFDPLDDYVVENNNKAITFEDIEFNKNSRLGKRGIVHFSNGIRASIIKLNEQFSQKFGAEYKISLLNEHGVPLDTDLCSREQTLNAKDTQELNELLKKSQKLDENGKLQPEVLKDNASEQMEDYDTERYQEEDDNYDYDDDDDDYDYDDDDYDRDDDDDMDNNSEKKAITFEDLKFEQYDIQPSFSKRASLRLNNKLVASVLEFSQKEQERYGYKYGIILRYDCPGCEGDIVRLSEKNKGDLAIASSDQKLIEMLNVACYGTFKEYINLIEERDCSKDKTNEEKKFITWDDLEFEQYGRSSGGWEHTWANFDVGSLHIIRIPRDNRYEYDFAEFAADGKMRGDAYGVRTDNKVFLNKLLRKIQCKYENGNLTDESIAEKDFNPSQFITIEFNDSECGKDACVELDSGLTVHITKYDKEKCLKNKGYFNKDTLKRSNEYKYSLLIKDYSGMFLYTDLSDEMPSTSHDDCLQLLKNDNELHEALSIARRLDIDGNLHKEKTETTKSTEKEFITSDDLEFKRRSGSLDKYAQAQFNNGLQVSIRKNISKHETTPKDLYSLQILDENEVSVFTKFSDNDRSNWFDVPNTEDLDKTLKEISQLTKDEIFYTSEDMRDYYDKKDKEKNIKAKQSLAKIRKNKTDVSGVYVADKIGEAMRSGVVSETVTPEKGKQLSDNIKKKYIMDRQQKS